MNPVTNLNLLRTQTRMATDNIFIVLVSLSTLQEHGIRNDCVPWYSKLHKNCKITAKGIRYLGRKGKGNVDWMKSPLLYLYLACML